MILSSLTALSEVSPLFIVRSFSQASRGIPLFSYNVPPLTVRRSPHRLQSRRDGTGFILSSPRAG
ncbi:hypothetical protein Bpfe_015501, partial [Biomphalaria pfeifferi]